MDRHRITYLSENKMIEKFSRSMIQVHWIANITKENFIKIKFVLFELSRDSVGLSSNRRLILNYSGWISIAFYINEALRCKALMAWTWLKLIFINVRYDYYFYLFYFIPTLSHKNRDKRTYTKKTDSTEMKYNCNI